MPIFRYFVIVGSALFAFICVADAYFGDHDGHANSSGSSPESAAYAPRSEELAATRELQFTRDVTPAGRVREVFAQFVPSEARRWKRYSATNTATQ